MEEWRDIPGFEGLYQVSSFGRVKSFHREKEKILNPSADNVGYLHLSLHKSITVHRLVAEVFLSDSCGKEVNHKDGDKTNNAVDNLELVSHSENMIHAVQMGLFKKWVVNIYNDSGDLIIQVKNFKDAAIWIRENTKYKNATAAVIQSICYGKRQNAYGYVFKKQEKKCEFFQ
jgi:hypothetical protein